MTRNAEVKGRQSAAELLETGLSELRGLAPGTAYVDSVKLEAEKSVAKLKYPGGRLVVVPLSAVPTSNDSDPPRPLTQLFAAQVRRGETGLDCSVLGRSATGPARVSISMQQALALAAEGLHTVFRLE